MVLVLSLLLILISVAFFTLLERKVLGFIILRVGPNKPSFRGILVPFADAIKLLTKPYIFPHSSSHQLMYFACLLLFLIPALLWSLLRFPSAGLDCPLRILFVLVLMSFPIFGILGRGWGSNRKYAILGATRSVAQSISYEVCLSLTFLIFALFKGLDFLAPSSFYMLLFSFHSCVLLFVICLAESNRSPFDFAEGESELVSGFNVEFSGSLFVVLFLSEYLSILFLRFLIASLIRDGVWLTNILLCGLIAFSFLWTRGTLPRYRYDTLMLLCWQSLLPFLLCCFGLFLVL